jgi:hypothetical protein
MLAEMRMQGRVTVPAVSSSGMQLQACGCASAGQSASWPSLLGYSRKSILRQSKRAYNQRFCVRPLAVQLGTARSILAPAGTDSVTSESRCIERAQLTHPPFDKDRSQLSEAGDTSCSRKDDWSSDLVKSLERLGQSSSVVRGRHEVTGLSENPNVVVRGMGEQALILDPQSALKLKEASSASASVLLNSVHIRLQAAAIERPHLAEGTQRDIEKRDPNQDFTEVQIGSCQTSDLSDQERAPSKAEGRGQAEATPLNVGDDLHSQQSSGVQLGLVAPSIESLGQESGVANRMRKGNGGEVSRGIPNAIDASKPENGRARWVNPERQYADNAAKMKRRGAESAKELRRGGTGEPAVGTEVIARNGRRIWTSSRRLVSVAADSILGSVSSSSSQTLTATDPPNSRASLVSTLGSIAERLEDTPSAAEEQPAAAGASLEAAENQSRLNTVKQEAMTESSLAMTKRQLDRRRRSHQAASSSGRSATSERPTLPPHLLSTFDLLNSQANISIPEVIASLRSRPDLDERAWSLLVRQLAWEGNLEAALECHGSLVQEGVQLAVEDGLDLVRAIA